MGVKEKLQELGEQVVTENNLRNNIDWVLENRQDLVDNYPNRWVAVDFNRVQCVTVDFSEVFQIMEGRQALSGSLVFYYSSMFRVPMILRLCDVRAPEIIS